MKKPAVDGLALTEKLYGSVEISKSKVSKPAQKSNKTQTRPFGRPSLIPGVQYPLTQDQEELLDKAWDHFCDLKDRGLV